jgi:mersacidin/lichenicidin family type 2 lantibiotic
MDVPEGMNVNVVENTDTTVHITMPVAPAGAADLSDEELANAAGGKDTAYHCAESDQYTLAPLYS